MTIMNTYKVLEVVVYLAVGFVIGWLASSVKRVIAGANTNDNNIDADTEAEDYIYYQLSHYNVYYIQGKRNYCKSFETEAEAIKFMDTYRKSDKGVIINIEKIMKSDC